MFSNVLPPFCRGNFEDAQDGGWDFGTVREVAMPGPSNGLHTKGDVRSVKIRSIVSIVFVFSEEY